MVSGYGYGFRIRGSRSRGGIVLNTPFERNTASRSRRQEEGKEVTKKKAETNDKKETSTKPVERKTRETVSRANQDLSESRGK